MDFFALTTPNFSCAGEPSAPKAKKHGWWAAGRIFWGHLEHDRFQSGVVPEAKSHKGSMKIHHIIGMCEDKAVAENAGPLFARDEFCACPPCRSKRFSQCEQKRNCGSMRSVTTPLVQKVRGAQTMTAQLEEFAATLHSRQLVAVRTPGNSFWLARMMGRAYEAEKAFMHAGKNIEEGWLLVDIKWFEKRGDHYELSDAQVPLIVNTIIRAVGLSWPEPTPGNIVSATTPSSVSRARSATDSISTRAAGVRARGARHLSSANAKC